MTGFFSDIWGSYGRNIHRKPKEKGKDISGRFSEVIKLDYLDNSSAVLYENEVLRNGDRLMRAVNFDQESGNIIHTYYPLTCRNNEGVLTTLSELESMVSNNTKVLKTDE